MRIVRSHKQALEGLKKINFNLSEAFTEARWISDAVDEKDDPIPPGLKKQAQKLGDNILNVLHQVVIFNKEGECKIMIDEIKTCITCRGSRTCGTKETIADHLGWVKALKRQARPDFNPEAAILAGFYCLIAKYCNNYAKKTNHNQDA